MRSSLTLFTLLLLSSAAVAQWGHRTPPPATSRTLIGVVTDAAGKPVPQALVSLKDMKTNVVKTFIAEDDGGYRFHQLSFNVDYEVRADADGKHSDTKTLSSFDTRSNAQINLRLEK